MAKIQVIIANLGSPQAPTTKSVSKYLKEFLSDPRVVDIPKPIWSLILKFIRFRRSPKVAEVYKNVWTEEGSPLVAITNKQREALQVKLTELYPQHEVKVSIAMTYQEPNIKTVVQEAFNDNPDHVILLPLYPQFSSTTTLAVIDGFKRSFASKNIRFVPPFSIINNYYKNKLYIEALANTIKEEVAKQAPGMEVADYFDSNHKLFISYHGIPLRFAKQMKDPYPEHCEATTQALAKLLGLKADSYLTVYQSIFGKEEWLSPALNTSLEEHAQSTSLAKATVICPAFSSDCIETLEENGMENKDLFLEAGGKDYQLIPCLNDREDHIVMMTDILHPYFELVSRDHPSH